MKPKRLHPSEAGRVPDQLDAAWPALPWRCPRCGNEFKTYTGIIATISPDGASASFLCALCDLFRYMSREQVN
jgi:hypothetical protein